MKRDFEARLKQSGIRPTAMRILALEALAGSESAVSLSDLEKSFEKSDRVTLYRTLKTFHEHKLIHCIDDGSGAPKYALCEDDCECDIQNDLHVHFHCRVCNETVCLRKYKIPAFELPQNFIAEDANLVVRGICEKCRA